MRLVLEEKRRFVLKDARPDAHPAPPGFLPYHVVRCGVCRTDAKIWDEGHREIVFPRVPGHELVVADDSGRRFAVWPGNSCGHCRACRSGQENLCDRMQILGFHRDGGYAHEVLLDPTVLVPVPESVPATLACFAEPAGCVLHALEKLRLCTSDRVVIYGGGTVGLIAALACRERGAVPTVVEQSEAKIERIRDVRERLGIDCVRDTARNDFDAALNACPDPVAFSLGLEKLGKGGRFAFFSGLHKNQQIMTNLLNLVHYRETVVYGAYGLCRADLAAALPLIDRNQDIFKMLVEAVISLDRIPDVLDAVLAGTVLKYVVDPGLQARQAPPRTSKRTPQSGDREEFA